MAKTAAAFKYSLNTSTIKGANLPLDRELEIAAKAGFTGVEPWIEEIEAYVKKGGALRDLKKKSQDLGLTIAGAVGFAQWIIDDERERAAGLEHMKRDMELVAAIGGTHIASPAIGAHLASHRKPELKQIADRYRAIVELGEKVGVIPLLELWGFSKTLNRLSDVVYCATECGHPKACMLLDSYHLYKGESGLNALHLLNGAELPVFHINDYPSIPPQKIDDADRVYPGDGIAPLGELFHALHAIGFRGFLSVELFNKEYWKQPADVIAKTAIEKTRNAVAKAFAK
jgi:sugar phosphate isomerase/epimerase